jgi:hypothetical protein
MPSASPPWRVRLVLNQLPYPIDTSRCATHDDLPLLYVGIAPKAPPSNGRPPSRQTLRSRIRYHYRGNAAGSTRRLTLRVSLL